MFRNRWVRRVGTTVAVLVVLGVVGFFYLRVKIRDRGAERLAAITAETDAVDPGWRYEDLDIARGALPEGDNSTLLVPRFKAARDSTKLVPTRPDETEVFFSEVPPNRHLDDAALAAVARTLDDNGAALAVARSFRDRPRGLRRYQLSPDVIGTLLPDVQESREVVAVLDLEAERLAGEGRVGASLQLVPAMLNVGRSLDGEPFIISSLIRIAIDAIAARRVERTLALGVPAGGLAEVQAALLKEADGDVFAGPVRGERACLDRLFTNLQSGTVSAGWILAIVDGGSPTPNSAQELAGWAYKPFLANDHAVCLETLNAYWAVAKLPDHQQRAALKAVPVPPKAQGSILTALLTPAVTKVHDASLRHRASLRCAAVGLAVERYRQKTGHWPDALADIPKALLPAIPLDPFDGQPLKYARRPDGVTVYSVGLDETDDGGNVPDRPVDVIKPGTDIGFRLFDVAKRGLPGGEPLGPRRLEIKGGRLEEPLPRPREAGPAPGRATPSSPK